MIVARLSVILPMVMWLTACSNRVVSDTPWFSNDSDAGAPHLRSGLWVRITDKKCRFDARQPAEIWPTCANGYVVRPHEMLRMHWSETTEHGRTHRTYDDWSRGAYVLVGGDPMIDQVAGCGDLGPHPVNEDGSPGASSDPRAYCYAVVRPTEFDAAGRIVGIVTWPVFCGPWPSNEQSDRTGHVVTATPFAGLHVVVEDCIADSEKALRNAARESGAILHSIGLEPDAAHWVRDSYH